MHVYRFFKDFQLSMDKNMAIYGENFKKSQIFENPFFSIDHWDRSIIVRGLYNTAKLAHTSQK